MTPHHCDICVGTKARRQLRKLLLAQPNMPTMRASKRLDIGRPYLSIIRTQMEKAGCLPRRTVDGRAQAVRDQKARATLAATQCRGVRGFPIGSIWAWDGP